MGWVSHNHNKTTPKSSRVGMMMFECTCSIESSSGLKVWVWMMLDVLGVIIEHFCVLCYLLQLLAPPKSKSHKLTCYLLWLERVIWWWSTGKSLDLGTLWTYTTLYRGYFCVTHNGQWCMMHNWYTNQPKNKSSSLGLFRHGILPKESNSLRGSHHTKHTLSSLLIL